MSQSRYRSGLAPGTVSDRDRSCARARDRKAVPRRNRQLARWVMSTQSLYDSRGGSVSPQPKQFTSSDSAPIIRVIGDSTGWRKGGKAVLLIIIIIILVVLLLGGGGFFLRGR